MALRPRSGSPPVSVTAVSRTDSRWLHAVAMLTRTSTIAANLLARMTGFHRSSRDRIRLAEPDAAFRFAQPRGEERQPEHDEDTAGRNPHDEAGDLLVRERVHVPRPRLLEIVGIPHGR